MTPFARSDNSQLAKWWWEVDRWLLLAVAILMSIGLLLAFAASPAVAQRIGLGPYHFIIRQVFFLSATLGVMIAVSMLTPDQVRRLAMIALPAAMLGIAATLMFGAEIKGARRWLSIGSMAVQPSEFLKPLFFVVSASLIGRQMEKPHFPGRLLAALLLAAAAGLLIMQPDFGQTLLLMTVWGAQMFLGGLPLFWVFVMGGAGACGAGLAYLFLPHVTARIDAFLAPGTGDTYQADTALNAFRAGGLLGRGPGEGMVKSVLPDAHTDYIFAVAGEEFGAIACLLIVLGIAAILIRGLMRLFEQENPFLFLATFGLLTQFGLQSIINISVNLALVPPKGMTLPFISYGGSSMLALGLAMGLVLALTRRDRWTEERRKTHDAWRYAR